MQILSAMVQLVYPHQDCVKILPVTKNQSKPRKTRLVFFENGTVALKRVIQTQRMAMEMTFEHYTVYVQDIIPDCEVAAYKTSCKSEFHAEHITAICI